jgi:hypothetical protein
MLALAHLRSAGESNKRFPRLNELAVVI